MQASIEIHPATTDDVPALQELERQAQVNPWGFATFILELSRQDAVFGVAKALNEVTNQCAIVGYVCGWLVGPEAQLHNIAVSPEMRRRGVATALMQHFLVQARSTGAEACVLEVRLSNRPAQCLYRKFGFEIVGRRLAYYSQPSEDACIMSCTLNDRSGRE